MKLSTFLPIGALVLMTAAARPQAARVAPAAPAAPAVATDPSDFSDVPAQELPAVRKAVEDEATHRDRLGRINRLREIATENGDRARLAQLDDLQRREEQLSAAGRVRARASLSDDTWNRTQGFLTRGGVLRARMASKEATRERLAQQDHKAERERNAAAGASSRSPTRSAPPARSASPSRPQSSGRGGSPR